MSVKQKVKYFNHIQFETDKAKSDLKAMLDQASDYAIEKLLKSLMQNSHKVLSVRVGQSRRDNYKEMIFVEVENLNNRRMTYRIDFISNGKTVEIMKEVASGWKQVSVW